MVAPFAKGHRKMAGGELLRRWTRAHGAKEIQDERKRTEGTGRKLSSPGARRKGQRGWRSSGTVAGGGGRTSGRRLDSLDSGRRRRAAWAWAWAAASERRWTWAAASGFRLSFDGFLRVWMGGDGRGTARVNIPGDR